MIYSWASLYCSVAPLHGLDVLNNFFNKDAIGHLIFNCYAIDKTIAISKETLEKYIPGPHPVPDGFVDIPVSGYPVIPAKYRKQ